MHLRFTMHLPLDHRFRWVKCSAILALASCPSLVLAESVSAGTYVAAPAGTNLTLLYVGGGEADSYKPTSGPSLSQGTKLSMRTGMLRQLRFFDIGNTRASIQLGLPFGHQDVKLGGADVGSAGGMFDPYVGLAVWPLNDPVKKEYFGVQAVTYLPLASYDSDRAVNPSGNRFVYILQAGYSKASGPWQFDLVGDVAFYQKNNESGPLKSTLKQDPTYALQPWLSYKLTPKATVSVGATRSWGGASTLDGVDTGRRTDSVRGRLGFAYWVTPKFQIYTELNRDFEVKGGYKFDYSGFLRLAWAY
ncbi:transporter [Pseudomonas aeruginosa]